MTAKRISRADYETKTLAALTEQYATKEILASIERFKRPPSAKRRPPINLGALAAVWVSVEWKRDQSHTGRRHPVTRACQLVAEALKGVVPAGGDASATVAKPVKWQQIKAEHGKAERLAEDDEFYRARLERNLAEARASLWPEDDYIPLRFVGGAELTGWLLATDRLERPKRVA
jgi:hypothetical protein